MPTFVTTENMSRKKCIILGAGGHSRVILDCLLADSSVEILALTDPDPSLHGLDLFGIPVRGPDSEIAQLISEGATHFVVGTGSVGDNTVRARVFELGKNHGLTPMTVCHPSGICSPFSKVGSGVFVGPAAVVNAGAEVGDNVIINSAAVVEHDCKISDHVHVATGARLAGGVCVDRGAFIGAGATVREGITIGKRALVAAGSLVIEDVDSRSVVMGVPARPKFNSEETDDELNNDAGAE